ncbi:MAG TPA: hypothetical protein VGF39_16515 [Stellaceae bacterium]|jgi:hypothetical protein
MGKRSDFPRRARDDYPTPASAIDPLTPFLNRRLRYLDPCSDEPHALADALTDKGFACAISGILCPPRVDARNGAYMNVDAFITNPPWAKRPLEAILINLSDQAPTWLLMPADWIHTKQSIPFLPRLRKIISVGRVKWIEASPHTSLDNVIWLLFARPSQVKTQIVFYGRT